MYCFNCEEEFNGDYHMTSDGYVICDECYKNNFFVCKKCNTLNSNEEKGTEDNVCIYCEMIK